MGDAPASAREALDMVRAGLGYLAAEMYERARGELPDEDPDRDFADRGLKLAVTFGGSYYGAHEECRSPEVA